MQIGVQVLVLMPLLLTLVGADGHGCYDDVDECVTKLQALMSDEDAFWFGSDYLRKCPDPTQMDLLCINPDRSSRSILTRLFSSSDPAQQQMANKVSSKLELAHVTITSPKGEYYGCGHDFESPPMTFRLDPLKVTTVNSWSLDHTPSVRWNLPEASSTESSLYTVMIWDVGVYYLHGLYINAKDGNMETAEVVDKYHGPMNPSTRANVFLFAVFRQSRRLDAAGLEQIIQSITAPNMGALPAHDFFSTVGDAFTSLEAANVMSVPGDAYAMERQKNNNIVNGCPYLFSQNKDVKAGLTYAGVKPAWSSTDITLNYEIRPFITTLIIDLTVEYRSMDDFVVDSCCTKTMFPSTTFRADPLGDSVTTSAITRAAPMVKMSPVNIITQQIESIRDNVYTLLMVDMTSAINMDPDPFLVLHWMVTNIRSADINTGTQTIPYFGPNPFERNVPRTYMFLVLKQTTPMLDLSRLSSYTDDGSCPDALKMRCRLNLSSMLNDLGIGELVGITWLQVEQDAFARKRLYTELMARSEQQACDGLQGYEDPCPHDQYHGHTAGASHVIPSTVIVTMTLAFRFLLPTTL